MKTLAEVVERFLPIPLLGVGAFFVVLGVLQMVAWARVSRWPTTMGVIVESGAKRTVVEYPGKRPLVIWVPNIRVRFPVGGMPVESETFTNRRPSTNVDGPNDEVPGGKVQAAADRHPVGQQVTVRYNPTLPTQAYVEYEVDGHRLIAYGVLLLLARLYLLPVLLKALRS